MSGLSDRAETAITALLSTYPSPGQKKAKLIQIVNSQPKAGGDFALWQLQKMSEGVERMRFGQTLLDRYPKSNWGPETSWMLMWPLYRSNTSAFLTRADYHLEHYPTSNSAPRVLFWKAKLFLSQGKSDIAEPLLKQLTKKYPRQYYAFRAQQLLTGDTDPWLTSPALSYPPETDVEVQAEALGNYAEDKYLAPVVTELIKAGTPKDIPYVLQGTFQDELPAPLLSMMHRQLAEYPKSLRIVRDYIDERRKAGNPVTDDNLYKLLYPITYSDEIKQFATRNSLDPFLVQALMRQESYFNPFAVSSSRAMGLMQLLPSTAQGVAQWEGVPNFQATDLFNPSLNVRFGTRYMRYLHDGSKGTACNL